MDIRTEADELPIADALNCIHEEAEAINGKLYSISSLAVGLRAILAREDCDHQPMVSAIELCSMIEDMAQTEANRADEMAAALSQLQKKLSR